jgi:hypothetical protein
MYISKCATLFLFALATTDSLVAGAAGEDTSSARFLRQRYDDATVKDVKMVEKEGNLKQEVKHDSLNKEDDLYWNRLMQATQLSLALPPTPRPPVAAPAPVPTEAAPTEVAPTMVPPPPASSPTPSPTSPAVSTPGPSSTGGEPTREPPCPPGDEDCVILFSEDYENPLYDFSDESLNYSDRRTCLSPEGEENAFFHWNRDFRNTINLAYGKEGYQYDQDFTVEPVYLQTWRDPATGQGLNFSDSRGGKYAIGMLASLQNDKLRLEFDTNGRQFVNFGMDIAPTANDPCKYNKDTIPTDPAEFQLSAKDKSSNAVLDNVTVTSEGGAPDKFSFLWTRVCGSLDVSQAGEDRIIILEWDALAPFYAVFDNLDIIASDDTSKLPAGCS